MRAGASRSAGTARSTSTSGRRAHTASPRSPALVDPCPPTCRAWQTSLPRLCCEGCSSSSAVRGSRSPSTRCTLWLEIAQLAGLRVWLLKPAVGTRVPASQLAKVQSRPGRQSIPSAPAPWGFRVAAAKAAAGPAPSLEVRAHWQPPSESPARGRSPARVQPQIRQTRNAGVPRPGAASGGSAHRVGQPAPTGAARQCPNPNLLDSTPGAIPASRAG